VDGSLCLDFDFSTSGNESRAALLPGGFREGAALLYYATGFGLVSVFKRDSWQIHGTLQLRRSSAFVEPRRDK
jgi:hypothetical protein